jgi:hypothetical protein
MFDMNGLKKEIETDFKNCKTKDDFVAFRHICYGMVFGVVNFLMPNGWETTEADDLGNWWKDEMLPKFNEKIAKMG